MGNSPPKRPSSPQDQGSPPCHAPSRASVGGACEDSLKRSKAPCAISREEQDDGASFALACAFAALLSWGWARRGRRPSSARPYRRQPRRREKAESRAHHARPSRLRVLGGPDARHYDDQVRPFLRPPLPGMSRGGEAQGRLPPGPARSGLRRRRPAGNAGWRCWSGSRRARCRRRRSRVRRRKKCRALADWIDGQGGSGGGRRRAAQGRVVLRRLNRVEYENTVRDLLGVDVDLKELLPLDSSADGFDNVGEALHTSSFLMEKYLEAADTALNLAIANRPTAAGRSRSATASRTAPGQDRRREACFASWTTTPWCCFCSSAWQAVGLSPVLPAGPRPVSLPHLRLRLSECRQAGHLIASTAAGMRMAGKSGLVGYFDAPADKPTVVEFVDHMEPRTTISHPPLRTGERADRSQGRGRQVRGTGLAVQWVEVEGPLNDTWPPESHRRIFGDLAQKPAPIYNHSDRVEVVSNDPEADAERILRDFARRAFRRAVTDDDVKPFVALVKAKLAEKQSFEQAVRVGLAGRHGVAGVPVPPREARQARRLRPGQPAVVLPLEHDARRGAARPRRAEEAEPAGHAPPAGRAHAQAARRRRRSPRTSSASGSACATSTSPSPATSSTRNSTTCSRCR